MTITEYYQLLYYLDDNFEDNALDSIVYEGIFKLVEYFQNPSKELIKEVSKDQLDSLAEILIKVIRHDGNFDTKRQIQLLGPEFGLNLLKTTSIERRMTGLKLISRYASTVLGRHIAYLS